MVLKKDFIFSPDWNTKQERNATAATHNIPGFLIDMAGFCVLHTWGKKKNN